MSGNAAGAHDRDHRRTTKFGRFLDNLLPCVAGHARARLVACLRTFELADMRCALLGHRVRKARELRSACSGTLDPCSGSDNVPITPVHWVLESRVRSSPSRFPVLHTRCDGISMPKKTPFRPKSRVTTAIEGEPKSTRRVPPRSQHQVRDSGRDVALEFSDAEHPAGTRTRILRSPPNERSALRANDVLPRPGPPSARCRRRRGMLPG